MTSVLEPAIRVECSWCDRVIADGPKDGTESHGICEPCFERELLLAGRDEEHA